MDTPKQTAAPALGAQPQGLSEAQLKTPAMRIILAAMRLIYTNPQVWLDYIKNSPDKKKGIAQAVDMILRKIAESAKGVPPETIKQLYPLIGQQIGPIIGRMLAELAVTAGVIDAKGGGAPGPQGAAAPAPGLLAAAAQPAADTQGA